MLVHTIQSKEESVTGSDWNKPHSVGGAGIFAGINNKRKHEIVVLQTGLAGVHDLSAEAECGWGEGEARVVIRNK